ncbi:MAG: hypothetical protein AAF916_00065 [Planctomycetota bacterium]
MASDTTQRDRTIKLAKTDVYAALEIAETIGNPWFRVQAYSGIMRFNPSRARDLTIQATRAAAKCVDEFERVAVCAWIVAALAEIDHADTARDILHNALRQSRSIPHDGSRAEALMLLLEAASTLGDQDQEAVLNEVNEACQDASHWRCKRALRDAAAIREGTQAARSFFG